MINFAKISGPKAEDMKEDWRKFHTEELSNSHPSTNIRLLKSRKSSGWGVWHEWWRNAYRVLVGASEGMQMGKILKCILTSYDETEWTGRICCRRTTVQDPCKCDNESLCSVKCGEFLDLLRSYCIFMKDPLAWNWLISRQLTEHWSSAET